MDNTAINLSSDVELPRSGTGGEMVVKPVRCVLMDDSDLDRRAIQRMARQCKLRPDIIETSSIGETRRVLEAEQPDVVMVDYRVPDGDGIAFAEEIRRDPSDSTPSVIVITGDSNDQAVIRALRAGAADFLPKHDITPDLIDGALENAMRSQGRWLQLSEHALPATKAEAELRELTLDKMQTLKAEVMPLLALGWGAANGTLALERARSDLQQDMTRRSRNVPGLIDDMLIAALVGSIQPQMEPVDLNGVVKEVFAEGADNALIGEATVTLGHLPTVFGDPARLRLLVALLLHDTVRACPANTGLQIAIGSGRDPKGNTIVWIEDNGLQLSARRQMLGSQALKLGPVAPRMTDPFDWSLCQRLAEHMDARFKLTDSPRGGVKVMMLFPREPRT